MSGIALPHCPKMRTVPSLEEWGTSTTRIIGLCKAQGLPALGRLRALELTERQVQIIAALRRTGSASVGELHRLFPDVSTKTIQRELQALV